FERDGLDAGHSKHGAVAQFRLAGREPEPAVTNHDRGHAVPARQRAIGIPVDLCIVMRVQIDKPRRDDESVSVKSFLGITRTEFAVPFELGNLAVLDADVAGVTRRAGAINDGSALNDHIEFSHDTILLCQLSVHSGYF